MELEWFRRQGIFFIPKHPGGWVILMATLGFAVYTFIEIDKTSHSASNTLMNFFFNLVILAIGYSACGWMMREKNN